MAESSIFHNVILDTPEKVEAFLNAAEASLADPYVRPAGVPLPKKRINSYGHVEYIYEFGGKKGSEASK